MVMLRSLSIEEEDFVSLSFSFSLMFVSCFLNINLGKLLNVLFKAILLFWII